MKTIQFSTGRTVVSILWVFGMMVAGGQTLHAGGSAERALSTEYQERPTIGYSLFKSDQSNMGEEAIQRVLASKFELPETIDVAILKIAEEQQQVVRYYGYGYYRSEEYLKNQQTLMEAITEEVEKSKRVSGTTLLPSILTPKEPTLSLIRESAVRLQSDMLLVFHLSSDIYQKVRFLQPNQAKGYCTCEGFLLDVRTGLIPFSRIATRDFLATKETGDTNFSETMARAEREAALLALRDFGRDAADFLNKIPGPGASTALSDLAEPSGAQPPAEQLE